MTYLKGIVVVLKTGMSKYAGTDDALFLGVSGTGGGREFPLDIRWFDDAERGSRVKYALGDIWDDEALAGAGKPVMADKDWNDPKLFYVDFNRIDRIYLRKQSGLRPSADDAYEMDHVEVALYAESPRMRLFRCSTAIWLGTEYGLQVWIPEVYEKS